MVDKKLLQSAVSILRAGGVVAFPTETVYGLGADATNTEAVKKIFQLKGRPSQHPLIVHLADVSQLADWAAFVPDTALQLAKKFWPGPMTLIFQRAGRVINEITGGQDTIGIRIPAHPVAQQLLREYGGGLAAPSANRFGHISPTRAQHVYDEFGNKIDMILDGGSCEVGIESTIIDVSKTKPALLRPGHIGVKQIETVIGGRLGLADEHSPRVSGSLASHYAPTTPARLATAENLVKDVERLCAQAKKIAVLHISDLAFQSHNVLLKRASNNSVDYARELYASLRELDQSESDVIIIEIPPSSERWAAIHDRLSRATSK